MRRLEHISTGRAWQLHDTALVHLRAMMDVAPLPRRMTRVADAAALGAQIHPALQRTKRPSLATKGPYYRPSGWAEKA